MNTMVVQKSSGDRGPSRLARLRGLGLAVRSAILTGVVALIALILAPVAKHLAGSMGLWAMLAAGGVCLLGAGLALLICHFLSDPRHALHGMLFGMMFRMGIPLGFATIVHWSGGGLAGSGFLYYLTVFYPVTLATEMTLSLPKNEPTGQRTNTDDPQETL